MQIKERSNNKQMTINMAASLIAFIVNLGVTFFLTPFIVKNLGAESYGFIKLSTDILSYTSLIAIALNSMAGRFITIAYNSGDIDGANKYFSSVFFSNLVLSFVILVLSTIFVLRIDLFLNIPTNLIQEVRMLFVILTVNNVCALLFGTWNVSTFIKNRLDLTNIRNIIGNVLNALILFCLFSLLPPHVWYIGVAGLIMTLYVAISNIRFASILTPDLIVRTANFKMDSVKELLSSGLWNLISRLGNILGMGLDLLIANIFISATYMGIFAITKNVPFMILSLFQMIASVFAPLLTNFYARGDIDAMLNDLNKSIRILGFFSIIPLCCLYLWGDSFYGLWMPTQDSSLLQLLTIIGTLEFAIAMPLEGLWNIFTITNKLKYSTLTILANHAVTLIVVLLSMQFVASDLHKLYILACTRSIVGILRSATFLPVYGAYCLGLPPKIFFKPIFKSLSSFIITMTLGYIVKCLYEPYTWTTLAITIIFTIIACVGFNSLIVLEDVDRQFIKTKIFKIK